jgi:uncharacterized protein YggE
MAIPNVSVFDARWRLTEKTKTSLGSQLRREAVKEAMDKARDFAEAAGYKGVRPVEITDGYSIEEIVAEAPAEKAAGGRSGEDVTLSLAPDEIQFKSSITMKCVAE